MICDGIPRTAFKTQTRVAVWDVHLTDEECARVEAGESPLTVRPASLIYLVEGPGAIEQYEKRKAMNFSLDTK